MADIAIDVQIWAIEVTARQILRHWDSVATDLGDVHVSDLIDHWVGQGNQLVDGHRPFIVNHIVAQNGGSTILRP